MRYTRHGAGALLALLAAVLFIAAACGDGDDGGAQATATSADHGAAGEPVQVSLTEWAVTGEEGAALPALQAGEVTFEVHNDGTMPHDFVVIATDLDAAGLPVEASVVDEEAAGAVIGRSGLIDAGDIEVVTLELEAGRYVLICNIAGHYEEGMYAALTVQ
jgi:uncharacterized cupredoxin-like copper-binding protein